MWDWAHFKVLHVNSLPCPASLKTGFWQGGWSPGLRSPSLQSRSHGTSIDQTRFRCMWPGNIQHTITIYNIQCTITIYNYNIHGFKPTFDSLYALTLIKFSGWVNSNTHLLDTTLLVCTKETWKPPTKHVKIMRVHLLHWPGVVVILLVNLL